MSSLIQRQRPFPIFADAWADLRVEEVQMATKKSSPMALAATMSTPPPSTTVGASTPAAAGVSTPSAPRAAGPPANRVHTTGYGRGHGRGRGRGRNQPNNGPPSWPHQAWNPYTRTFTMWAGPAPLARGPGGVLGSQPNPAFTPRPQQAMMVATGAPTHPNPLYGPPGYFAQPPPFLWDQHALAQNFNTMQLTPRPTQEWHMDSGASSHMASSSSILSSTQPLSPTTPSSIIVGNGSLLPVTSTGHSSFHCFSRPLHLYSILISPHIIKNPISVCRFTTDNNIFVIFDPFGSSVKDLITRNVIVRCNSIGELYSLNPPPAYVLMATTTSPTLWHRCLGHLSVEALSNLASCFKFSCNKR